MSASNLKQNTLYPVTVLPGESIKELANNFKVSIKKLRKINNIPENADIHSGEELFVPKHSRELTLSLPTILVQSLDYYLVHGNVRTKDAPNFSGVDIPRACLIRYLLSAYGYKNSKIADYINSEVWSNSPKSYNMYVSILTTNRTILQYHRSASYRLTCAMVYCDIPILGYFKSKHDFTRKMNARIKKNRHIKNKSKGKASK